MSVHTKWSCLIPILSSLVKDYLFHRIRDENVSYSWTKSGMIMYNFAHPCQFTHNIMT